MGYIDELMGTNERPIFITRKHWNVVFRKSLGTILTTFILLMLGITLSSISNRPDLPENIRFLTSIIPLLVAIFSLLILLSIIGLGIEIVRWQNQVYIITNWRVLHVFGIFNKTSIDSSLEKINDVKLEQSWLGRIFNYGDIEIVTGSDIGVDQLKDIANPLLFKRTLINAKDHNNTRPAIGAYTPLPLNSSSPIQGQDGSAGVSQPNSSEIPALIDKLKALRDAGALTEQEYQVKKSDLLKRM